MTATPEACKAHRTRKCLDCQRIVIEDGHADGCGSGRAGLRAVAAEARRAWFENPVSARTEDAMRALERELST